MAKADKAEKLRVGVVGVGALGRHHARLYNLSENAEVVGVYDVNPKTAQAIGGEFGLKVYDDMFKLAEDCEAMSVAVPATRHFETAIPLMKMNKHLLIEKPLAVTIEEAQKLVSTARRRKLVLAVGHTERFNPAMDFLEKRKTETHFIEAHRLANYPPPRPGQHRRGTEVGVVLDLMIHDIDLILNMVDSTVERIDAVGIPVLSGSEDIVNVRVKFKNGSVANITASRVSVEPMRRFRVFQTDCYISMDYGKHTGMIIKKNRLGLAKKDVSLDDKNALQEELENFIASCKKTIKTGKVHKAKVSGQQGLNALKLAVEITNEIKEYNDRYNIHFA